ncbi:MAG: O-antigen ligase family protein, partial [Akkermansiaceae bacterium]|nr:O-antigen ligase family protein [Akkermansiaceae bacterium]
MQALAGILFVAALALAVLFGGQTVDYSWGPALVVLAPAVLLSLAGFRQLRERGWGAWLCSLLLASAWGWTLYACAHSPVKQFARSDALLVGGMILCFVYGLLLQPAGKTGRLLMGGLALLGIANGVVVLLQVSDPDFSWPFASRPSTFPSGFFGHYNHLADFAAVGAALLTARLLFAKDRLAERILQALGIIFFGICIAFAKSRGGLVGCAAAAEVIAVGAFLIALRERSKWLRLLALLPLLFLVLGGLAGSWMLKSFESARGVENASAQGFADNRSRLVLYGIALRVSADHPLTGGGSRSFGWRKYSSWNSDPSAQDGKMPTNDDFAHNEVLQTAVDYGWLGAGLVVLAIMTTGLTGVAGLMMKDEHARSPRFAADATVIGGLAGLTATLVNSNFSFVTHTFPGAMYLGLTLAMVLPRRTPAPVAYTRRLLAGIPVTLGALATADSVLQDGNNACRVYLTTWPVSNTNLAIDE